MRSTDIRLGIVVLLTFSISLGSPRLVLADEFDAGDENQSIFSNRLERHRTMGIAALGLMGFQVGIGAGLYADKAQPPNQGLRALHTMSSIGLLGLAIFQIHDGPALAGDEVGTHGKYAYVYLALLATSGVLGILTGNVIDRDSGAYDTLAKSHLGLGLVTAGAVTMTIFHAPL